MDRSFFRFVTNHAFDRQRDKLFSSLDRVCIRCSAVKIGWTESGAINHEYYCYFSSSIISVYGSR